MAPWNTVERYAFWKLLNACICMDVMMVRMISSSSRANCSFDGSSHWKGWWRGNQKWLKVQSGSGGWFRWWQMGKSFVGLPLSNRMSFNPKAIESATPTLPLSNWTGIIASTDHINAMWIMCELCMINAASVVLLLCCCWTEENQGDKKNLLTTTLPSYRSTIIISITTRNEIKTEWKLQRNYNSCHSNVAHKKRFESAYQTATDQLNDKFAVQKWKINKPITSHSIILMKFVDS